MMYEQLYEYLILHSQLALPGVGTFVVERKPAETDFPNKTIHAPVFNVVLNTATSPASKNFFTWLAAVFSISEHDAILRFNDFIYELKKQISSGSVINWTGLGTISSGLGGSIKFSSNTKTIADQPVVAERIIREKYEHTVRVGEEEKTSTEMVEMLGQPTKKTSIWWAYVLVVGLAAIIFICWYFSENGLKVTSTAYAKKISPKVAMATYRTLP